MVCGGESWEGPHLILLTSQSTLGISGSLPWSGQLQLRDSSAGK